MKWSGPWVQRMQNLPLFVLDLAASFMPSLVQVAGCYHTRFIDTAAKARFTGAIHFNFHPENAREEARKIVRIAVDAFVERDPKRVEIPAEPVSIMPAV